MHPGNSADFSYTHFRQLLHTARCHFTAHLLGEAPDVLHAHRSPVLFLRHDIKISLSRALRMAEIEHEYGLPATYMIRADSPLYSLDEKNSRLQLWELAQMGHEVGLHFDLANDERQNRPFLSIVEDQLRPACERVEQITYRPVRSLSFHRRVPQLFDGPLQVCGRVNADACVLRQQFLSDVEGNRWNGKPSSGITLPGGPVLQLLLHPIWWGDEHMPAPQRLQEFFDSVTQNKSAREASIFDIHLAKMLPAVRRQGIYALVSAGREA